MINKKIEKYLKENPDVVCDPEGDQIAAHHNNDAVTFGTGPTSGKLYIWKGPRSTHTGMVTGENGDDELEEEFTDEYGDDYIDHVDIREALQPCGRLWTSKKLISFWGEYPKKERLNKIISDLNKKDIPINDNWIIDIDTTDQYDSDNPPSQMKIRDYANDDVVDNKNSGKEHVMSPMLKSKSKDHPDHPLKDKLPKGMSVAQYHNLIHQESEEVPGYSFKSHYITEKKYDDSI